MTDWRTRLDHLRWPLSLVGLVLALAGIALDDGRIVWVAIGVLGLSVVVKIGLRT